MDPIPRRQDIGGSIMRGSGSIVDEEDACKWISGFSSSTWGDSNCITRLGKRSVSIKVIYLLSALLEFPLLLDDWAL